MRHQPNYWYILDVDIRLHRSCRSAEIRTLPVDSFVLFTLEMKMSDRLLMKQHTKGTHKTLACTCVPPVATPLSRSGNVLRILNRCMHQAQCARVRLRKNITGWLRQVYLVSCHCSALLPVFPCFSARTRSTKGFSLTYRIYLPFVLSHARTHACTLAFLCIRWRLPISLPFRRVCGTTLPDLPYALRNQQQLFLRHLTWTHTTI